MSELSKFVLGFLTAFVDKAFTPSSSPDDDDYTSYRETALRFLKHLFSVYGFSAEKPKSGMGNKTVSHNARERFYVRVQLPNCAAPIVLKPRWKRTSAGSLVGLYGYYPTIDSDVVSTPADLETFIRTFDPDKLAKGQKPMDVICSLAARQESEDIGNNFAQSAERKAAKATAEAAKIAAFVAIADSAWQATRPGLLLVDSDLVTLIDEQRSNT